MRCERSKENANGSMEPLQMAESTGSSDEGTGTPVLSQKMERLEKEIKCLTERNEALASRAGYLIYENGILKSRNETLEKENSIFKKELAAKGIEIESLLAENKNLSHRVGMNPTNSSKPPSSEWAVKHLKRSTKVFTGKKPGGQPGHEGSGIKVPKDVDNIVLIYPDKCIGCAHLEECSASNMSPRESRYKVDIVMNTVVTEYRSLCAGACPLGMQEGGATGTFPYDVKAYAQYGDSVAIAAGLLNTYGAISLSRISLILRNAFGITVSPATAAGMVSKCAKKVRPALEGIKQRLTDADVCHFDETGARVGGSLLWVHNSSNSEYTYQTVSGSRGYDGIAENGVLPAFDGTAVHDCWKPYWKFDVLHGTCGVHLVRELRGIEDLEPEHVWPRLFRIFLLSMRSAKEEALAERRALTDEELREFDERYDRIMRLAGSERPPPKAGRARGKERALIERLIGLKHDVCRFAYSPSVPFGNNQAEQDVRNVKTKVKVSGCFRTIRGCQDYLDVMSYIGTARKHGIGAFQALSAAFAGRSDIVL